ncbi:hypothetical protein D3C85_1641480 [compost metagenome]
MILELFKRVLGKQEQQCIRHYVAGQLSLKGMSNLFPGEEVRACKKDSEMQGLAVLTKLGFEIH